MLDLNLTTLCLEAGEERREMPGLYAVAPKKAARLRSSDRLVLHFCQAAAAPAPNYSPLPANLQQELLSRLAETYFTSGGSVTAGIKAMAERLNDFLINRNLRQSRQQNAQVVGMLTVAVVHGSFIYFALAGPMHVFLVRKGAVEHLTDAGGTSRGLGLARVVNLRFFQTEVEEGLSLVLSADAPAGWNDAVLGSAAVQELGEMRRALIGDALNLDAVLLRFSSGRGEVRLALPMVQPRPAVAPVQSHGEPADRTAPSPGVYLSGKGLELVSSAAPAVPVESAAVQERLDVGGDVGVSASEPAGPGEISEGEDVSAENAQAAATTPADTPPWEETSAAQTVVIPGINAQPAPETPRPGSAARQESAAERAARRWAEARKTEAISQANSAPSMAAPDAGASAKEERPAPGQKGRAGRRASPALGGLARMVNAAIGGVRKAGEWMASGVNRLAARALPDQPAEGLQVSPAAMLIIALVVPALVVTVSATVYFERGRGKMRDLAVQTARQYMDRAQANSDRVLQRQDWNQAMSWLARAENYGTNQEISLMRRRVQSGLDALDGLTRLEFRPALSGSLGDGVVIKRMLPVVNDVYLLDASQNRVLRVYRSGQGYEIDLGFVCASGEYGGGSVTVGPLVDITTIPAKNFVKAVVMAIDGRGNVLLCSPNEPPSAQTLLPPDVNWGNLARAFQLQGVLYVLDTQMNQVYRYIFSDDQENFVGAPGIYFDLQVPRLGDVIDLAADQEYLYLLHADGSMTSCYSAGASTQCDDPAPFGDPREDFPSDPLVFEGTKFSLMQSTQPPDLSLYILDTLGPSIYNFSHRRLNLQRLFQPYTDTGYPPAGKTPQAFAITSNRRVLLAVDSHLYMAPLP